jgi:beta-glucosidase
MTAPLFMFATGIENSYPTIRNRTLRVDEMDKCGHYKHGRTDFDLLEDLNIHTLALRSANPYDLAWTGALRLGVL